jgi:hypothetical protein
MRVEPGDAALPDRAVGVQPLVCLLERVGPPRCINAGLVDAIRVSLVPVLLGDGVPFFANLENAPVQLADPQVVDAKGVTHLYYAVS